VTARLHVLPAEHSPGDARLPREERTLAAPGEIALGYEERTLVAPGEIALAVAPTLATSDALTTSHDHIRVFLCDDAAALRDLLRTFLELGGDVTIVGEAGDGEGLTEAVREAGTDVLLLDLSMPRVDGLEALADLRAAEPELGIIVLSGFEQHRMEAKALALGADRYLEKAVGMEDVRATVRAVAAARRGAQRLAGVAR
jgi:CheY-like chemotaxis protein